MGEKRLIISASGGRTSMMLAVWADQYLRDDYDLRFVFCNTGQEDEETLRFINRVDKAWGLGIVWLESVTQDGLRGSTYRETDFNNACRDGSLFESMIRKYGIPNKGYPHCNRELKINPMKKWRNDHFKGAQFAVGIRADEIDRISSKAEKDGVIYPFINMRPTNKADVLNWWMDYPELDLKLPEHYGNCKWCWKKSNRKLMTIAIDNPEVLRIPDTLEQKYKDVRPERGDQFFFRSHTSARELAGSALLTDFTKFTDTHNYNLDLDMAGSCSESCDVFIDE